MTDMETIYAWTETGPEGGEGVIAVMARGGFNLLLQHRDKGLALRFRNIAERHARKTGHRVRLVEFIRARTIEEYVADETS